MADRYFSVVKGEHLPSMVTEGAATSSEAIELRVTYTDLDNRAQVLAGLEAIKGYIATVDTWPPA